jgi:UDP-glucuronate 4-epimerase
VDDFNDYYNPSIKRKNIRNFLRSRLFRLYECDITDFKQLKRIFEKEKPEQVLHLAARAGVRNSFANPFLYFNVNISGTLNLLELSAKNKVGNFVFTSSSSVYGERKKVPFKENDKLNPISPYAVSKIEGESLCRAYSNLYNLPLTCLRLFTVYGPRGRPDMAPFKFINSILNGKPIQVYGDGSSLRDYTYVDDITEGIIAAAHKKLKFEIINLGNSNPIKLSEFIKKVENAAGKKAKIHKIGKQTGDVPLTFASISKAKRLLNWKPRVNLNEGLKRTFHYLDELNHLS